MDNCPKLGMNRGTSGNTEKAVIPTRFKFHMGNADCALKGNEMSDMCLTMKIKTVSLSITSLLYINKNPKILIQILKEKPAEAQKQK